MNNTDTVPTATLLAVVSNERKKSLTMVGENQSEKECCNAKTMSSFGFIKPKRCPQFVN